MKKIALLCCFSLLAAGLSPLAAQTFRGALVGGFNLSQIDGDLLHGYNQIGLNGGAKVFAVFSDRWELSVELLFSQKGSRLVNSDQLAATIEKIRLNMVETPVMINFRDWKIQVGAGLSYGRLTGFTVTDLLSGDVTDLQDFNPNQLFVVLGGTFYFDERWGAEVRWSRALTDLQANPGSTSFYGRTITVRAIYLLN